MSTTLWQRLHRCPDLPSLPAVAAQVIELGRRPDVGLGEVAEVIGRDPALAAKLLRIVNSPLYAQRRKVENLRQALMVLGMNAALTLALGFTLAGAMRHAHGALDLQNFWRRSLTVAVAARAFGARAGVSDRDGLLLAGLLQDIGMLALDAALPMEYADVLAWGSDDHAALALGEVATFEADHAAVGAWLLESWGLSSRLVEAARTSHARTPAAFADLPAVERSFAAAVAVADQVATLWCMEPEDSMHAALLQCAADLLGLSQEAVLDALAEVSAALPEIAELFDVPLADAGVQALLDQAREAMLVRNLQVLAELSRTQERAAQLQRQADELATQARTDALTGLRNRAWLAEVLPQEFAAAGHGAWPLSVLMLDLDHFKRLNDTLGHLAGDEALRQVGQRIEAVLRSGDALVRFGGEEFLALLPGAGPDAAQAAAERLRLVVAEPMVLRRGDPHRTQVTVSVGIATYDPAAGAYASAEELVAAADRALYRAKHAGRDRVASASALRVMS